MKSYVYLDVLFLVNLLVNYIMLAAAGKIMGIAVNRRRAVAASIFGGLYSAFALFVPLQSFFSLPARFAFGLFMVTISYPKTKGLAFVALSVSFYLCSAVVAGTSMALYAFSGPGLLGPAGTDTLYFGVRWWSLGLSLAVLASFGFLWRVLGARSLRPPSLMQVELTVDGHCVLLTGLVDTGNDLRDPVSGLPVIVVDWDSLQGIMPREVNSFFLSTWDSISAKLLETNIGKKLRLIPYASISGRRGVLPGFKPDGLAIVSKSGNRVTKEAVVGISESRLSPQGLYQVLLHPELITM